MSNKLCLYEKGNATESEMYSVWLKISISYNSCQYSFVIASVGFNIDRVTTQHTPTCVENCSGRKVSIIVYLTFTRSSVTSVITLKTTYFSQLCTDYFVMNLCLSCAQTVTLCFMKLIIQKNILHRMI